MMVRVEDERDRVSVLIRDLVQDAGVKARIDHGRNLACGITDHIPEVLHRADHVLLEEHGSPGKSLAGLSVLLGPEDMPKALAKGGPSSALERPLPPSVSNGEDMEARLATASSWGFLVQVAHMRHRPACSPPI